MRAILTSFGIARALCLALLLALALAPAVEATHHGPGTLVAEAGHHSADPHHHHPEANHDASDHDHVSVGLMTAHGIGVYADLVRESLSGSVAAENSPPDSPRRPPRPMRI